MLNRTAFFLAAICASCALLVAPSLAHSRHKIRATQAGTSEPTGAIIDVHAGNPSGEVIVPLNKSQVVRFDRPIREINVGSKDIATVVPLSRTTAVIVGRKMGATNMTLADASGHVIAIVDLIVSYDIEGLQRRIHDLMPDEQQVDIRPAGDNLVLSGHVSSSDHLRQIVVLANGYADGAKVTNLLSIGGSQQVMLEVRFTEISRNALKDLGVNSSLTLHTGSGDKITSDTGTGVSPTAFGVLTGLFSGSKFSLQVKIDALEGKGLLRTLAEPNLVALSGETASFLAGGEFPIPVAQGTNANGNGNLGVITVEFKDFGVGLGFTPTVIGRDLVNLAVNSEVSSIDPTLSVDEGGVTIPGLKVRRAKTTVELHDGESFAIAGMLQNDFQDTINQVPGLGSLPIIGALFRSTDFQRNQTELAIFITVHLVQPSVQKDLAAPTDTTLPPDPLGLFGMGDTQSDAVPPKSSSSLPHGDVLP
jgi:pilus assembly protein CpaC